MIANVTQKPVRSSTAVLSTADQTTLVYTSAYGWRVGIILRIGLSPYHDERRKGISRAFVVNQPGEVAWSEYVPEEGEDEHLDREYAQWLDLADARYDEMMDARAERLNR